MYRHHRFLNLVVQFCYPGKDAVEQEGNFPVGSIGEKTLFTNFVYLNKTSSFSPYFFIIVFQEICCRILFQTQLSDLIGQVEFTDLYDGASHIYY
ncbi:MAG: hypothetical protein D3909_07745 [Candidatus Electrothrix sp. ATG1]|nr:hypothetical protein [Candidatus Electrothrix sp. ATG1]